jgi:superfamily II DNA or RNA helicase
LLKGQVPEEALDELREQFTHKNPVFHRQRKLGFRSKEPPQIETWAENSVEFTLPRGGTDRLRAVAEKFGLELGWADQRTEGDPELAGQIPSHDLELWPQQKRAKDAMIAGVNCILRAPTGSGKTSVALAVAAELNLPTLVIVCSAALAEQWSDRVFAEMHIAPKHVGKIGGGKMRICPLTIAMQQSLRDHGRLTYAARTFGVVICDEVQRFGARTFVEVIDKLPARYRLGFSADESRKDQKEFLIYDQFGNVAANIGRRELEAHGRVTPVRVVAVPTDFEADWYVAQCQRVGERKKGRPAAPDFTRLLEEMIINVDRNAVIRRAMVGALHAKFQTLVFTHRRDHVALIESMGVEMREHCGRLVGGEDDAGEFRSSAEGIRAGNLRLAAGTYQAIGMALDLPGVEAGVAATPIHTNKQFFNQVRGRLCRKVPGKERGYLYYIWDRKVFGDTPVRNLLKWNDGDVVVLDGQHYSDARRYLDGVRRTG